MKILNIIVGLLVFSCTVAKPNAPEHQLVNIRSQKDDNEKKNDQNDNPFNDNDGGVLENDDSYNIFESIDEDILTPVTDSDSSTITLTNDELYIRGVVVSSQSEKKPYYYARLYRGEFTYSSSFQIQDVSTWGLTDEGTFFFGESNDGLYNRLLIFEAFKPINDIELPFSRYNRGMFFRKNEKGKNIFIADRDPGAFSDGKTKNDIVLYFVEDQKLHSIQGSEGLNLIQVSPKADMLFFISEDKTMSSVSLDESLLGLKQSDLSSHSIKELSLLQTKLCVLSASYSEKDFMLFIAAFECNTSEGEIYVYEQDIHSALFTTQADEISIIPAAEANLVRSITIDNKGNIFENVLNAQKNEAFIYKYEAGFGRDHQNKVIIYQTSFDAYKDGTLFLGVLAAH